MPKKRGRFIPCRGGGTDTTYYTDDHNVDEDARTIIDHGGHWEYGNSAGVACRHMYDIHTNTYGWVASICRHPKLIKYYTDYHDVDEDVRTIPVYGGLWSDGNGVGITLRGVNATTVYSGDTVASVQKKINRTYSPCGDACFCLAKDS